MRNLIGEKLMKLNICLFLMMPMFLMTVKAEACNRTGQEERIRSVCGRIQSMYAAQNFDIATALKDYVYDECGIGTVAVYEGRPPFKLVAYPLRPFLEGKLKFAEVPSYWGESPFVLMARKLRSQQSIYLKEHQTSLGLLQYKRDYWGHRCNVSETDYLVVTTAQVVSPVDGYVGATLSAFTYDMLDMPELNKLVALPAGADASEAIKEFTKKAYERSYLKIADALLLPSDLVLGLLTSRLKDPEFLKRFLEVYQKYPNNKYALLGILQSDIEHTVAMASMPANFDPKQKIKPQSNEAFFKRPAGVKSKFNYFLGISTLVILGLLCIWIFKRISNRN